MFFELFSKSLLSEKFVFWMAQNFIFWTESQKTQKLTFSANFQKVWFVCYTISDCVVCFMLWKIFVRHNIHCMSQKSCWILRLEGRTTFLHLFNQKKTTKSSTKFSMTHVIEAISTKRSRILKFFSQITSINVYLEVCNCKSITIAYQFFPYHFPKNCISKVIFHTVSREYKD